MSIEENKAAAIDFLAKFSATDFDGAKALTSDDFTWWTAGNPEKLPSAGLLPRETIFALLGGMGERVPGGVQIEPKTLTAEGDRVAVEAVSHAKTAIGRIYNNEYHFLFLFTAQGKIRAVKEYMDTMHVKETFFD